MKEYGWRKPCAAGWPHPLPARTTRSGRTRTRLEQLEFPAAAVGSGRRVGQRLAGQKGLQRRGVQLRPTAGDGVADALDNEHGSLRIIGSLLTVLLCGAGLGAQASAATAAPESATAAAPGDGVTLTPPMSFNNWNSTHSRADFNEAIVKRHRRHLRREMPERRRPHVRQPPRLLGAAAARRSGQARPRLGALSERHQGPGRLCRLQGPTVRDLHQRRRLASPPQLTPGQGGFFASTTCPPAS